MALNVKVMHRKLPTNTPITAIAVNGFFMNGAKGLKKLARVPRITTAKNFGNREIFSRSSSIVCPNPTFVIEFIQARGGLNNASVRSQLEFSQHPRRFLIHEIPDSGRLWAPLSARTAYSRRNLPPPSRRPNCQQGSSE